MTPGPSGADLGPVLVTGGTGFLGRRLVERLLGQGRRVTILCRSAAPELEARGARVVRAALDEREAVRAACSGQAAVFHVAAKVGVWGPMEDYYRANVLGTRAVLEGCRAAGVRRLVHTSTPSVVYNGRGLRGADESLPLTKSCPSPYPVTKAIAEAEVLAAHAPGLHTVALRPHLIWGPGDPHLVPRILARAQSGRLRIVGEGNNRVDLVHVENAVDAHLAAEAALARSDPPAGGCAYFITNGEPVLLWPWINGLLTALGRPPVRRRISLPAALAVGAVAECVWRIFKLRGEPPITRFVAAELAKDHWFDLTAARRDLGYAPRISMAEGTAGLIRELLADHPAAGPPQRAQSGPPSRH